MSLMIMEGPDEKIAVELYKDGPNALEAFHNLKGKIGDPSSRATFILLDQDQQKVVHYEVRDLPIVDDPNDEPWGHELGVGPMEEPKEISEESGNSEDSVG